MAELTDKQRKMIWRKCWSKASRNWQTWVELVALVAILSTLMMFCGFLLEIYGLWASVICVVIGGSIGGFIWAQLAIKKALPYIHQELNSHQKTNNVGDN